MRKTFVFIVTLIIAYSSSVLGEEGIDLSGNWKIHTTSHRGYETWETKILLYKGKYEVITVQPYLGRSDGALTLTGDTIRMVFPFTYGAPGTDTVTTTFVFTGTVGNETMRGTKITRGTDTHGDGSPVSWVALKIPESE